MNTFDGAAAQSDISSSTAKLHRAITAAQIRSACRSSPKLSSQRVKRYFTAVWSVPTAEVRAC